MQALESDGFRRRRAHQLLGRHRVAFLGALLLTGLLVPPLHALTVGEVLQAPEHFDGEVVTLTGRAQRVRTQVSRHGNEYTTFSLTDGSGRLTVFAWGNIHVTSAERVEVHGQFDHVKHVGRYTFYNELSATSVLPAH